MATPKQKTLLNEIQMELSTWISSKDLHNPDLHSKRLEWSEKICKDYSLDAKHSEELTKAMNSLLKIVKLI